MTDTRIKINTVFPTTRTDGNVTKEYFVSAYENGSLATKVLKESELTKEMRNNLNEWFWRMFTQLPRDMQNKIKAELK